MQSDILSSIQTSKTTTFCDAKSAPTTFVALLLLRIAGSGVARPGHRTMPHCLPCSTTWLLNWMCALRVQTWLDGARRGHEARATRLWLKTFYQMLLCLHPRAAEPCRCVRNARNGHPCASVYHNGSQRSPCLFCRARRLTSKRSNVRRQQFRREYHHTYMWCLLRSVCAV